MTAFRGASSRIDPYIFDRDLIAHPSYDADVSSKTLTTPRPTAGQRTGVFIVAGQSNSVNCHEVGYTIINPTKVDNLNPLDGAVYRLTDPMLGCQTVGGESYRANMFTAVADKLVTASVFDRVILAPVGIGATKVSKWDDLLWKNILVAHRRALAVGLTTTAVLWQQGESYAQDKTDAGAYVSSFQSMQAKIVAAGCDVAWFLAKSTWVLSENGIDSGPSPTIRSAIDTLLAANAGLPGPDTDTLGTSYRQPDKTHFNLAGVNAGAALWSTALDAVY